jgi:hypothetical protein
MSLLDTAFGLAVTMVLLKAGDLILRDHQKRALTRAIETITLTLDYVRPLAWFRAWVVPRTGMSWPAAAGHAFTVLAVINVLRVWRRIVDGLPTSVTEVAVGSLALGLAVAYRAWLFPVVRGVAFVASAGGLVLLAVWLVASWLDAPEIVRQTVLRTLGAVTVVSLAAMVLPVTMLVAFVSLLAIHIVAKALAGLGWRLIEYSKGTSAALLLVLTTILGVAEIAMRWASENG